MVAADGPGREAWPLPWHAPAWKTIRAAVATGQLPHALLLEGSPGTGRNRFATALARLLLCHAPDESGACGTCRGCELCAAGSHPDYRCVEPAEDGRAIGIDLIRTAIDFLAGTAVLGSHKVVVVSPAERLTMAAFNAFLKSLEEPSQGTFLLLVTARGHPVPATIRSRCQRWNLPDPGTEQARGWLREHCPVAGDDGDLEQLMALGARQPLYAVALRESQAWDALVELDECLRSVAAASSVDEALRRGRRVEAAAPRLDPGSLLDRMEMFTRSWLRGQNPGTLRSARGRAAFTALDELSRLRSAQRAGSNPNTDLLRHRAVQAVVAALAGGTEA